MNRHQCRECGDPISNGQAHPIREPPAAPRHPFAQLSDLGVLDRWNISLPMLAPSAPLFVCAWPPIDIQGPQMRNCPNGHANSPDAGFCSTCGTSLHDASPTPVDSAVPAAPATAPIYSGPITRSRRTPLIVGGALAALCLVAAVALVVINSTKGNDQAALDTSGDTLRGTWLLFDEGGASPAPGMTVKARADTRTSVLAQPFR
jgi:hypothetical protein